MCVATLKAKAVIIGKVIREITYTMEREEGMCLFLFASILRAASKECLRSEEGDLWVRGERESKKDENDKTKKQELNLRLDFLSRLTRALYQKMKMMIVLK